MPAPKSMKLFFIDNQKEWPDDAQLVGDMVIWPDKGKYPTFTPVALASAADFDGRIVMMAGNRGLVMAFCPGATNPRDVQKAMSGPRTEQYRIGLDSLVQRMLIHRHAAEAETEACDNEVNTVSLLTWLARSNKHDAGLLASAIRAWLKHPHAGDNGLINESAARKNWEELSELLEVLEAGMKAEKPSNG